MEVNSAHNLFNEIQEVAQHGVTFIFIAALIALAASIYNREEEKPWLGMGADPVLVAASIAIAAIGSAGILCIALVLAVLCL